MRSNCVRSRVFSHHNMRLKRLASCCGFGPTVNGLKRARLGEIDVQFFQKSGDFMVGVFWPIAEVSAGNSAIYSIVSSLDSFMPITTNR